MPAIIAIGLRDKPRSKGPGDRSNLERYPFPSMKQEEAPPSPPQEGGDEMRLGGPMSTDDTTSPGGAMFSKAQTGYSGASDTCASCSHFLPPTGCKYVAGGVEEGGRCNLHSNMTGGESAMEEKMEGETPAETPPPPEPMEEEEEA